jgi:hypothetical protein
LDIRRRIAYDAEKCTQENHESTKQEDHFESTNCGRQGFCSPPLALLSLKKTQIATQPAASVRDVIHISPSSVSVVLSDLEQFLGQRAELDTSTEQGGNQNPIVEVKGNTMKAKDQAKHLYKLQFSFCF